MISRSISPLLPSDEVFKRSMDRCNILLSEVKANSRDSSISHTDDYTAPFAIRVSELSMGEDVSTASEYNIEAADCNLSPSAAVPNDEICLNVNEEERQCANVDLDRPQSSEISLDRRLLQLSNEPSLLLKEEVSGPREKKTISLDSAMSERRSVEDNIAISTKETEGVEPNQINEHGNKDDPGNDEEVDDPNWLVIMDRNKASYFNKVTKVISRIPPPRRRVPRPRLEREQPSVELLSGRDRQEAQTEEVVGVVVPRELVGALQSHSGTGKQIITSSDCIISPTEETYAHQQVVSEASPALTLLVTNLDHQIVGGSQSQSHSPIERLHQSKKQRSQSLSVPKTAAVSLQTPESEHPADTHPQPRLNHAISKRGSGERGGGLSIQPYVSKDRQSRNAKHQSLDTLADPREELTVSNRIDLSSQQAGQKKGYATNDQDSHGDIMTSNPTSSLLINEMEYGTKSYPKEAGRARRVKELKDQTTMTAVEGEICDKDSLQVLRDTIATLERSQAEVESKMRYDADLLDKLGAKLTKKKLLVSQLKEDRGFLKKELESIAAARQQEAENSKTLGEDYVLLRQRLEVMEQVVPQFDVLKQSLKSMTARAEIAEAQVAELRKSQVDSFNTLDEAKNYISILRGKLKSAQEGEHQSKHTRADMRRRSKELMAQHKIVCTELYRLFSENEQLISRCVTQSSEDNIKVFCRVRPPSRLSKIYPTHLPTTQQAKAELTVADAPRARFDFANGSRAVEFGAGIDFETFKFDSVFSPSDPDISVYKELDLVVRSVMQSQGSTFCLFSYGPSWSTKDISIFGAASSSLLSAGNDVCSTSSAKRLESDEGLTEESSGLILLAVKRLLETGSLRQHVKSMSELENSFSFLNHNSFQNKSTAGAPADPTSPRPDPSFLFDVGVELCFSMAELVGDELCTDLLYGTVAAPEAEQAAQPNERDEPPNSCGNAGAPDVSDSHSIGVETMSNLSELSSVSAAAAEPATGNADAAYIRIKLSRNSGAGASGIKSLHELTRLRVRSTEDARILLAFGLSNSKDKLLSDTQPKKLFEKSHVIVLLKVIRRNIVTGEVVSFGDICFVSLAGSEKFKMLTAPIDALRQAQAVGKSLTVLADVIRCVSNGSQIPYTLYKGSQLTLLLQDFLRTEPIHMPLIMRCGGNSHKERLRLPGQDPSSASSVHHIYIILHIDESGCATGAAAETLRSLKYGRRIKSRMLNI